MLKITELTEEYLIREYIDLKKSTTEISKQLNCCSKTISIYLKKYRIPARPFSGEFNRRYSKPNLEKLTKCDTEGAAYFLGFFAADGNFTKAMGGEVITFELQTCDKPILEKFKEILEIDNPIKYRKPRTSKKLKNEDRQITSKGGYMLRINCLGIKKVLDTFNLGFNNKSDRISSDRIPKNMIQHFIRGYFDGDGCISTIGKKYPAITFTSSSRILLLEFSNLFKSLGFSTCVYRKTNSNCLCLRISLNSNNIGIMYNFLYKDADTFLLRKKNKFKEFLKRD